jgi:hypothetical protein
MAVTENGYPGVSGFSFIRLTPNAAGTVLNGLGNSYVSSKMLMLVNLGPATITVNHQSGAAAAADRIITATGAAVLMLADDTMILMYDSVTARWRQITGLA